MPLAVALIAIAGVWQSEQRWVLALGAVLWIAIALMTRLPPEAQPAWRSLVANRRSPIMLFAVLAVATVAAVLVALAEGTSDEPSWAAGFFAGALIAWAAGLSIFEFGTYQHTNRPWLEWMVGPSALIWPAAVYAVARWTLKRPFAGWVFLAAALPPFVLWAGSHLLAKPKARTDRRWLRLGQTALLLLSGIAMLVAGLRIPVERRVVATSELSAFPRPALLKPMTEAQAVATYSPVLRLDPLERWRETSVKRFEAAARIVRTAACGKQSCEVRAIPDDQDGRQLESSTRPSAVLRQGVEYPHIAPLTGPERAALPAAIRETRTIVEYWLFYPFDSWDAATALGGVVQNHPADWEFVAVGFDDQWEPIFVGYSEHCKGVWRTWKDVPVVSLNARRDIDLSPGGNPTHPFVVVARGSHANYPTTGSREPDWAGCLFHKAVRVANVFGLIGYAANARESTPDTGPIEIPSVAPLAESEQTLDLRWWWGDFSDTTLAGLGAVTSHVGIPPPWSQPNESEPWSTIGAWPHDRRDDR